MIFSHKLLVIRNYVLIICTKTDDLAKLKHFNIKTKHQKMLNLYSGCIYYRRLL